MQRAQVQPRGVGIEVTDSAIPEWTSNAVLDWQPRELERIVDRALHYPELRERILR